MNRNYVSLFFRNGSELFLASDINPITKSTCIVKDVKEVKDRQKVMALYNATEIEFEIDFYDDSDNSVQLRVKPENVEEVNKPTFLINHEGKLSLFTQQDFQNYLKKEYPEEYDEHLPFSNYSSFRIIPTPKFN